MKLLIVSNERQFELQRLLEEAKALGVPVQAKHPRKVSGLRGFSHVLFRQIRGDEKKAIKIARQAKKSGLGIVDSRLAKQGDRDKQQNRALLKRAGFFVPKTFLLAGMTQKKLDSIPSSFVVIKPLFGKRGQQVFRVRKNHFFEFAKKLDKKKYFAQEFVLISKELRVFVVGKRVLGAIEKIAGGWVRNFSRGAKPKKHRLTKKIKEAALRACRAVGTEIAGVDIAFTRKGIFVLEVNRSPGFKFFEKATKKNVAREIIKFVVPIPSRQRL